jgi:hypothetical protein
MQRALQQTTHENPDWAAYLLASCIENIEHTGFAIDYCVVAESVFDCRIVDIDKCASNIAQ